MPTTIERELKKSNDYMLTRTIDKTKNLLDLTFKNVCRVEAMIKENRSYQRAQDATKEPEDKPDGYHGSSAYWFAKLKYQQGYVDEVFCKNLVTALDSENSTHLNSRKSKDGEQGRDVMTKRVFGLLKNFKDFCKLLEKRDLELINKLARPDDNYSGRELAFASKFCHYAAFWLFEGKDAADNYSIFDSIVSAALIDYATKYKVDSNKIDKYKTDLSAYNGKRLCKECKNWQEYDYAGFYKQYQELIDATRKKASIQPGGGMISRNGFDHLLWYAS